MGQPSMNTEWQGQRTKMLCAFSTDEKLWARCAEIRVESFRAGYDGREATDFCRRYRKATDAGAVRCFCVFFMWILFERRRAAGATWAP